MPAPPRHAFGRIPTATPTATPNALPGSGPAPDRQRRRWLMGAAGVAAAPALALLGGCGTPLPLVGAAPPPANPADAEARLRASAQAHGGEAWAAVRDISVGYDGQWRPLIGRIQPEVVDAGFRGRSQERLIPGAGIVAQAYTGPAGHKQVAWRRGDAQAGPRIAVWRNGQPDARAATLDASALVAEAYGLFLLGPLWLAGRQPQLALGGTERVNSRLCDVLHAWVRPGLGRTPLDRVTLLIDREDAVTRRLRFTLEGFANTQGAVAEVDTFEHRRLHGVLWPMRSYEAVVHPLRLPAHDWHITGLEVNRGFSADDLAGPAFTGAAAAPARAV